MLFDNNAIIYPTDPEYNIYYRLSGQLREHLIKNGFCVDEVSRVNVGEKEYYALDFNLKKDEWSHRKTNHTLIAKLLKVKNVGLVDFFNHDDMIHEVILIDEDELNDKYVVDDNFDFTTRECHLSNIIEINDEFSKKFVIVLARQFLSMPLPMNYETWSYLHEIVDGDMNE